MNMIVEEREKEIGDYFNILRRHTTLILSVMAIILATSLGFAFGLPAVYKSSSTILIEQQQVPQDFVRTLVTSFAEQRIQVISQKILSTKNLVSLIEKYDLYAEERKIDPLEVVIENMKEKISLEMISADIVDPRSGQARSATIAFSLSFQDHSAKLAQSVTNELTNLFLNENIRNRTETSIEASAFLESEAGKLRVTIAALEEALATFKEENADNLPELAQLNLQVMNRTEQEILEVQRHIRNTNERKIYLAAELAQQPETIDEQRYNPAYDIQRQKYEMSLQRHQYQLQARSEEINRKTRIGQLEPDTRLEALQAEYLASVSKYSSGHPDVQRLKREIDSLRTEVGSSASDTTVLDSRIANLEQTLSSARERYSADHPDIRRYDRELNELKNQRNSKVVDFKSSGTASRPKFPGYNVTQPQFLIKERPNPAHVQLKSQLEAADTEIASLENKIVELEKKRDDYEGRLTRTPQVERQYQDLTRDFDTATLKYREITSKQLEAQLSQSLESERKGERFTLIEPPILPLEPFKPNRLAIAFLGFVFSLAGGIGAASLAEALNQTVSGRHGVMEMMGEAPLASIPYIITAVDIRKKIMQRSLVTFGMVASALIAAVLVHFYVMPLDVFWFKSLRKFGI
ncbi:MAG: hypothetical protein AB8D52_00190 [Gammaproteobacteria bacterium]